ncbi:amylo-alpha-1,6-glucosidase [Streptomyces sp. AC495_CC817]|uniref:amylo-alpha-1,6-glucosidase n=1 Tax=Streptomyces sp. AC495_CC817 TaxID=2823900 RepID=UPI001C26C5FB|nr:glycogen debranching protein [Streptomyces sp. AC495_CC817]
MTDAADLAALAGRHLDLVAAPFTLPRSRVLVFREGDGVRVHTSEYEKRLSECRVLDALVVTDAEGAVLPVVDVLPGRVRFGRFDSLDGREDVARSLSEERSDESKRGEVAGSGPSAAGGRVEELRSLNDRRGPDPEVTLTFDGPGALSLGGAADARVRLVRPDGSVEEHPLGPGIRLRVADDRTVAVESGEHAAALAASASVWEDWFATCPRVRDDLQEMTAFCWWVLGANIVELPSLGDARAIVPSKIGYVGLWQWDAYFIAVGLRHGDPELAREQLSIAFRFPQPDGQLPDVVHEEGVLATSDDLPESDRDTLRRAGSQIADPTAPVPLTKPPLAAWALRKVLEAQDDPEFARAQLARVIASQDWWFAGSDLDHDGMPEYGHPYSSGLDDSPVFDGPLPTAAPDLGAYLVRQDLEIAELLARYEPDADATRFRDRAVTTQELLLRMWDADRGRFVAYGGGRIGGGRIGGAGSGVDGSSHGEELDSDTVLGLLPLLTGALPAPIAETLREAVDDPTRFGLEWGLPTVAASDPDFSPERMWRGPIWVNTSMLVAEGLEASGWPERARELREQTVALVIHGGGPHEYFNPRTGLKAETATTAFGWSAALFIDLAVTLTG